jgi:flagellar hook-associated protein 1 FlgK
MSGDLFIIGASGVKAYRTAMSAISENIANANTPGYARRTTTMSESGSSTATMALYISKGNFGGTAVTSINRETDPYLDAALRMSNMSLGSATARLRWMSDTETALNDSDTGVGKLMTGFFSNIDKLAASPSDTSLRVTTLDSISRIAEAFQQTATDLSDVSTRIGTEAQSVVNTANTALTRLAEINNSLLRAQPGTSAYAQLLDSRDSALSEITTALNVEVSFGARDTATITYGGQTLVSGNSALSLTVTADSDGTLNLSTGGTALTAPTNGVLGGLFASADTVAQRHASLDTLAAKFVTDVNSWHAAGRTDGNPGTAGAPLLSGTTAASMAALITDPAQLATKSADGTANGNLLTAGTVLRGAGSAEANWTALIATQANLLTAVKAEHTTAQSRSDQALIAREAVSGIDLNTEAADLLRIQQAYSGSAKILQVARETVDTILQII